MKALAQLGLIKSAVHDEAHAEDRRVLALFRNRAELKKAYGELQDEVYRLKDRIKQQEGATARVQEMLAALETRLGLADTAYPALVFYQLRALWELGCEFIEQFIAGLAQQQEERERRLHLAEHNRRQFVRRQSAASRLRIAEKQAAESGERLTGLLGRRSQLTRLWHYFKRREIDRQIHAARAVAQAADGALLAARAAAEQVESESAQPFPGISLDARRMINLAAIAYAEVLCLRLADTPLLALAKQATSRREAVDDYGSRTECEALIAEIARARALLQAKAHVIQDVKARTERLKKAGRYRNAADTIPVPESLAYSEGDVLAGRPIGELAARMPNVLAEDTWGLLRVLLR